MTVLFRDDFDGPGFLDGRTVSGCTWESNNSTELDGTLHLGSSENSVVTLPSTLFEGAYTWVEVEFGYSSLASFGQVGVKLCAPTYVGFEYPNNPGVKVLLDKYYGDGYGLISADTVQYKISGGSLPSSGVVTMRMTVGSVNVEGFLNGASVGLTPNSGSAPMTEPATMVLKIESIFGSPTQIDYVEVRNDADGTPSTGPFWTAFRDAREI